MASKKMMEAFNKKVVAIILKYGGVLVNPRHRDGQYEIQTNAGTYSVTVDDAESSGLFTIWTRFEDHELMNKVLKTNYTSSKHNFHCSTAKEALKDFENFLKYIIGRKVESFEELVVGRTYRNHNKQFNSQNRVTYVSDESFLPNGNKRGNIGYFVFTDRVGKIPTHAEVKNAMLDEPKFKGEKQKQRVNTIWRNIFALWGWSIFGQLSSNDLYEETN